MSVEMPYAKINGEYKIVSNNYTPAKVAELKSKSAQAIADELLADGVGTPPDKDWKNKARVLSAGGGEAGCCACGAEQCDSRRRESERPGRHGDGAR